jgi:hypothetical protein
VACASLQYSTTLFHKGRDLKKKGIENKMGVLLFSQLFSETFLILRRTGLGVIKNVFRASGKVLLFLSDFNEI